MMDFLIVQLVSLDTMSSDHLCLHNHNIEAVLLKSALVVLNKNAEVLIACSKFFRTLQRIFLYP
jgi:hypothetical protein